MTTIDTELFIGGAVDGRRLKVLHGSRARFSSDDHAASIPPGRYTKPSTADYREAIIRGEAADYRIWVAEGTTIDEALQMLFAGYRAEASA